MSKLEASDSNTGPAHAGKLRVFVSYSRDDADFADELVAGLEYDGNFEVSIDHASIHEGEKWRNRLKALIAEADTVVFVLSPASAVSATCKWEADVANQLSKRILPVLASPLGNVEAPEQLSELNYIRFDPDQDGHRRSFIGALSSLRRALNTDIAWLREHTRLLNRAQEWEAADRAESRLLIGHDVKLAKKWLHASPQEAPKPTELHLEFINASELAEAIKDNAERQRADEYKKMNSRLKWLNIITAGLVCGIGFAGYQAYLKSVEATQVADQLAALQVQIEKGRSSAPIPTGGIKPPSIGLIRGQFSDDVVVEMSQSGNQLRLLKPVSFKDSNGRIWTAPAGSISDGASIPRSLWSVLGSPFSGEYRASSIIHDHYVTTRERSWQDTHKMLYEALLASGVSRTKAQLLYSAVYRFGPRWEKN